MDEYSFKLENQLKEVSSKDRLLFAFWISKKLFHNYIYFNKLTSFGNIDVLFNALNLIEKYLEGKSIEEDEIKETIAKVEENIPDTNDFPTIIVSFALDACNAINECLWYMIDKDINHIINTGIFARDTVDMFIQEKENLDYNDLEFEIKIRKNELMKTEMTEQENFLLKIKEESEKFIRKKTFFRKVIEPKEVDGNIPK